MKVYVAAVGQRMPAWVKEAWNEYARRFPPALPLELKEIRMSQRSRKSDAAAACKAEGEALLAAVPQGAVMVALDERGLQWTSAQLAKRLEGWMQDGRDVAFLVGGPDGLSQACRAKAELSWSLGRGTYPHALVRVMVAEQLYRAWSMTRNHPYHRA